MKLRGGYTGDRIHVVKCRISPALYNTLVQLAAERQITMALLLRELLNKGLREA